jgi:hypothetical protein
MFILIKLQQTLMQWLKSYLFLFFIFLLLLANIRGLPGNPNSTEINTSQWVQNGPFDLSPERGRFALMYSLIEDKSFYFSVPLARFTAPDLGYKNDHYVSLFAPGLSFIIMPGYIIGKLFGISQIGSFAIIALFALLNAILIIKISIHFGAHPLASKLASLAFVFGSPSFSYAVSLYQHHISTFLILSTLYLCISKKNLLSTCIIWFLIACAIPIDYPNIFLLLPIVLTTLSKIINLQSIKNVIIINIKPLLITSLCSVLFPMVFFLWFNLNSYDNAFQLSGTIPNASAIDASGKPAIPITYDKNNIERYLNPEKQTKSALGFFKTRNLVNGLYIHTFSPDRGIINYSIILVFGLALFLISKKQSTNIYLPISIIAMNILLYSMWGDPYGGWAFGSRYLIPSYAMLAILFAQGLTFFRYQIIITILSILLFGYSVYVNAAGALTSNANPPKVEVLQLEKITGRQEKFTFSRNLDLIYSGQIKSILYQTLFKKYLQPKVYFYVIILLIVSVYGYYSFELLSKK